MRSSTLVALSLAALCALAVVPLRSCAIGAPLTQPQVISSTSNNWAATITLQAARMDAGEVIAFNTRLFCYLGNCSFPGPTIQVSGQTTPANGTGQVA